MTRGYSLMELVVVLAILAVATAVVAPAVGRTADDVRVRTELAGLAGFLRTAREQAVTQQQALEVTLDPEAQIMRFRRAGREGEASVQASRAVSSLLRVASDPARPRLTFLPHGMSSGARFTIELPLGNPPKLEAIEAQLPPEAAERPVRRRLSFIGMGASGGGENVAERHEEIIREHFAHKTAGDV